MRKRKGLCVSCAGKYVLSEKNPATGQWRGKPGRVFLRSCSATTCRICSQPTTWEQYERPLADPYWRPDPHRRLGGFAPQVEEPQLEED